MRLIFPFFAGLLLLRAAKLTYIKNAFFWCSVLLIIVLSIPRIGDADHLWMNGLYESVSIIVLFPLIVYLGASGDVKGKYAGRLCKFLGDISYPIYITHYPIIYTYFGWVYDNKYKLEDVWPVGLLAFASSIALSYLYLKVYDEPVRAWLTRKLLVKTARTH